MQNRHSGHWYETFLDNIPESQTEKEVAFLMRQLPNPPITKVLDLCCGSGRHSHLLAREGYDVTGIDINGDAIRKARRTLQGNTIFLELDLRDVKTMAGPFDAALSLWQSFGYFSDAQNEEVLRDISRLLPPGGRLVLDIYHREFFQAHQGTRIREVNGRRVRETKTMSGNRLTVQLAYEACQEPDEFEWQLYTPSEISDLAGRANLECVLACTDFDEATPASPENPRMQLVFAR
jgi:SAM-dependent methyltransferase